jgi:hypothetical protein
VNPPAPTLIALFFVVAAALFWWLHRADSHADWFEDLPVYARALHDWQAGRDPYSAPLAPLFFLYPPVFLYIAAALSFFVPGNWGGALFVVADVAAVCALPLVLARFYFRQSWLTPLFALLVFFASPRFTGVLALGTLNVASLQYCVAFVAAIPGLRRNRWGWFYLTVFCAAIIKVTFLSLLLLPLLAAKKQWLRSVACGAAVVLVNVLQKLLLPKLYHGYQESLNRGIVAMGHYGYGLFGIYAEYVRRLHLGPLAVAYSLWGVSAVALLSLAWALRQRILRAGNNPAANGVWLATVIATIILVNPRQMQYDADVALFAGFVLWVYAVRARRLLTLLVVLFLPCLVMPHLMHNQRLYGMYETLLVTTGLVLSSRRLWQESVLKMPQAAEAVAT